MALDYSVLRGKQKMMPKRYDPKEAEKKWTEKWESDNIFRFNQKDLKNIYSIDTPPPTVSGPMHIGHAFSYSQNDFLARFKRMRGYNVFFPFGSDDNGIATERLIEKEKNVQASKMDRKEFTQLCLDMLEKIRPKFIQDWKNIGMSCDWKVFYSTINEHCRRISQRSFIDLYKKGREYRKEAPSLFCPHCQTAISQVECEDKQVESYFNDIIFKVDREDLVIATTRPELLPACVAIFFHPDDERYQKYKGKNAKVPLFEHEIPIIPDPRADPEKGTGIVMCCTFGDQTDMEWYYAHELPLRDVVTKEGKLQNAGKYSGMSIKDARSEIINDLQREELLVKQEQITHAVNVHERCGTEIEIIHTKQWFIKYLDLKDKMLQWGDELNWYPNHMKVRYDNWVKGLQWDWLISRQRFHGIPFPVWYCEKCEEVILANEEDLPVEPMKDEAPVDKCPRCGHDKIVPEKDVFDTWATSSLTPQLAVEMMDEEAQKALYPMSLRPQAHDIITFWLFNTVVKSQLHNRVNPWKDVVISGHAQDPHGRKMSKSKGNVVVPQEMIEKYGADALRYWAAGSKLGDDLPFQEKDLQTGVKFATKLWNSSKFTFMHLEDYEHKQTNPELMDRWLLSKLHNIIKVSTEHFDKYEYSKTKALVDKFFWQVYCDNYLEIVKDRLYNPDARGKESRESAQFALYETMLAVMKMMAPIMPYVTEEIYQYYYADKEKHKSIHLSSWPEYDETKIDENAEKVGDIMVEVIEHVRRVKSENSMSLKSPVKRVRFEAKMTQADYDQIEGDLIAATKAENVEFVPIPEDQERDTDIIIEV